MRHLLLIGALVLTLSACDSTESGENETLRLSLSSVEALLNGFHYEGWAIIDGTPVSTGKFNVDGSGRIVDLDGDIIPNGDFNVGRDLSMASAIVITIEPDGDTDALPATTKFMGGDLSGTSTNLMADHGSSLDDDFTSAAGTYILATPTNDTDSDENSGVWFLDLSSGSPATGLDLPTLPDGWKYE